MRLSGGGAAAGGAAGAAVPPQAAQAKLRFAPPPRPLLLSLLLLYPLHAQIRLSQNPVSGDCRLKPENLRPITPAFFPYFYRYEWDAAKKLETFWLSPVVRVRIEQRACIRHHITYEVRVPGDYPLQGGFTRGLMALLDTVLTLLHRENPRFLAIKNEVFPKLLQQAALRSIGEVIMLPYHEWSFLLRLDQDKAGSVIVLETIQYLSSQVIQRAGVPEYMDDALGP